MAPKPEKNQVLVKVIISEIPDHVIGQADKNDRMADYLKTDTFQPIHVYFLKASP